MALSPRTLQSMKDGGGRHYKGRGLGDLKAWKCVGCGTEQAGALKDGCVNCGAGKPGVQVRKPGDPLPKVGEGNAERPDRKALTDVVSTTAPTPPRAAPASALRIPRASAVDYDEIERRVARVLEQRLGGGFSEVERATLYQALTVYIGAWEDGLIDPASGLPLAKTRELAARVLPEELPAMPAESEREAETHGNDHTTTRAQAGGAPDYDGEQTAGSGGDDLAEHASDADDLADIGSLVRDDGGDGQ